MPHPLQSFVLSEEAYASFTNRHDKAAKSMLFACCISCVIWAQLRCVGLSGDAGTM
jgi:hypothetical protein